MNSSSVLFVQDFISQLYGWPLYIYVISYTQDYYTTIVFITLQVPTLEIALVTF